MYCDTRAIAHADHRLPAALGVTTRCKRAYYVASSTTRHSGCQTLRALCQTSYSCRGWKQPVEVSEAALDPSAGGPVKCHRSEVRFRPLITVFIPLSRVLGCKALEAGTMRLNTCLLNTRPDRDSRHQYEGSLFAWEARSYSLYQNGSWVCAAPIYLSLIHI